MHFLITRSQVFLLLIFLTTSLQSQSSGFHLQTEQGISALNNFNMKRGDGGFGGYATSLGGEYRFRSGFYLKADVQLMSAQIEFRNNNFDLRSIDTLSTATTQVSGSTKSKEYRVSYGAGVATNWKKVRFALDLAHSIEFHQRAETIAEALTGFFIETGATAISSYNEPFLFKNENWQLVSNSVHQLQLTGSILAELSPKVSIGLFYRNDLFTRWIELQLEHRQLQTPHVAVERREARQAMTGVRFTYQL